MYEWRSWINRNWKNLCAGKKLCVAQNQLAHPSYFPGIFEPVEGWSANQTCDWGLALADGSRIHVQCYTASDGTPAFCIHRDKWDPNRDIVSAAMHAVFETPLGAVLGVAAMLGIVGATAR
jgi:hypothetical protein